MESLQQLQGEIPWSAMHHLPPASATSPALSPRSPFSLLEPCTSLAQHPNSWSILRLYLVSFYLVKLHDACAFVLSLQYSRFFFSPSKLVLFVVMFCPGVVGQCSPSSLLSFYRHLLSWLTLLPLLGLALSQAFVSAVTHKRDFWLVPGMKYWTNTGMISLVIMDG